MYSLLTVSISPSPWSLITNPHSTKQGLTNVDCRNIAWTVWILSLIHLIVVWCYIYLPWCNPLCGSCDHLWWCNLVCLSPELACHVLLLVNNYFEKCWVPYKLYWAVLSCECTVFKPLLPLDLLFSHLTPSPSLCHVTHSYSLTLPLPSAPSLLSPVAADFASHCGESGTPCVCHGFHLDVSCGCHVLGLSPHVPCVSISQPHTL